MWIESLFKWIISPLQTQHDQQSQTAVGHYSGAAMLEFRGRVTIPSWKAEHQPLRAKIILPDRGLQTSTCLSPWRLASAATLFEASNGGTSPGNQLCFQGPGRTLTPPGWSERSRTRAHFLPFSHSFSVSPSHSPEWQLLNCDKQAVSDQPPLPGGLAKWPFHYPTTAVFPLHR